MPRPFAPLAMFIVALAAAFPAAAGDPAQGSSPAAVVWKLGLSDMARYERWRTTKRGGDTITDDDGIATVMGHDLRDGGLYMPVTPARDDLAAIFGLRTPAPGVVEMRIDLHDAALRVRGTVEIVAQAGAAIDVTELRAEYTFATAGRPGDDDRFVLRDGHALVHLTFDRARGVVTNSKVELTYSRERVDKRRGDKAVAVNDALEFKLASVARQGNAAFPVDVNAAIDRGVAHLKRLQKVDGTFEPHGGYEMGTTALAAYTLVSCGVPAEDPGVEKALALVCASDLTKTYEQAVGLMAVERAYTPPGEAALGRAGEERKAVRDVPAPRRAWCERTAALLEAGAGTPGSWGYPAAPNAVMQSDSSNTQYAVLGLQSAARLGIEVRDTTWLGVVRHFSRVREADGPRGTVSLLRAGQAITETVAAAPAGKVAGFRYWPGERRVWGSMTCAGIASLSIARHELRKAKNVKFSGKQADEVDEFILGGWAWLDQHWGVDRHPEKSGNEWYYYKGHQVTSGRRRAPSRIVAADQFPVRCGRPQHGGGERALEQQGA